MKTPKATREKELETILTLCVALVVIYFLTGKHHVYMLVSSIVLGLIGMFSRYLTAKISWAWLKIGELMGAVMSKVILSLVFYIFLFPMAMLYRLFNKDKDNLQLKRTKSDTYYTTRNHIYDAKDLKNVW